MNPSQQRVAWKRYLRSCAELGYDPEPTIETRLLQRYTTLYHEYCYDNNIDVDKSKELEEFVQIEKLSQLLYLDLCEELGYECIIKIRRDLLDIKQYIYHRLEPEKQEFIYDLGSRGEGLRIDTSDVDQMVVFSDNVIVNDAIELTDIPQDLKLKAFIMERSAKYPGYVHIKADNVSNCKKRIKDSICLWDGVEYLSSFKFRNHIIPALGREVFAHGPCTSIKQGHRDCDIAYCLKCTFLPFEVTSWKHRCERFVWPSKDLVDECISQGCQIAPVGFKSSSNEHFEWRISFILMEKKLLYSLNHVQFMCYGMLKLFLNEVVNSKEVFKDILSSYIMKTTIFWEIHECSDTTWSSNTIIQNFRKCIERLYFWVKTENCPNFFVPANNMFACRMESHKRKQLQTFLKNVLGEKCCGLFNCYSIDLPYVVFQTLINDHQQIDLSLMETDNVSNKDKEIHSWHEINAQFYSFLFKQYNLKTLQALLSTLISVQCYKKLSTLTQTAIKTWISETKVYIASHEFKKITEEMEQLKTTEVLNTCTEIFRNNDHPGSVALLYLATAMYITGRYNDCLEVIIENNKRLKENYLQVIYFSNILQLQELRLELETTIKRTMLGSDGTYLHLDPSVYACMLSVLCYHHLGCTSDSESEYQLLQEICSDIPYMKVLSFQEISWQILGICAETLGKFEEAYHYYLKALKSKRMLLTDASCILRILCLLRKLSSK